MDDYLLNTSDRELHSDRASNLKREIEALAQRKGQQPAKASSSSGGGSSGGSSGRGLRAAAAATQRSSSRPSGPAKEHIGKGIGPVPKVGAARSYSTANAAFQEGLMFKSWECSEGLRAVLQWRHELSHERAARAAAICQMQ